MELTVGYLKKALEKLDDNIILAHLDYNNKDFKPQFCIKRLLVVKDESQNKGWGGHTFLVINGMGSHFTGKGEQEGLKFTGVYFDDKTFNLTALDELKKSE